MNLPYRKKQNPLTGNHGQALTEYITLLVLIALVGVGAAQSIGKLVRKKMMKARMEINKGIKFDDVRSAADSDSGSD